MKLRLDRAVKGGMCAFAAAGILSGLPLHAHAVVPGDIVLGDITVFRLKTASGGVSAEKRADMVQERVNEFLAIPNLTAKDVHVTNTKYGPTIYVRNIKIITVDPDTAKDQNVTPLVLAKTWAHRLMGVINQVDIRVPGGAPATGTAAVPGTAPAAGTPAAPASGTPAVPAPATPAAPAPTTPAPAAPAAPVPATPTPAAPAAPAPATPTAPAPTAPAAP